MTETKKKLLKIEGLPGSSRHNGYTFTSMNFAFVSSPSDGRRQVCSSMTCREYVNRTVWAALNHENTSHYNPENPPMDFTKLRLLVVHDASDVAAFKQRLFNGKAALNLFEAINEWRPSTITTVNHSHYSNAWLLTGPQEWVSQPQLLSLATWVLRLASFAGPLDVSSYDALEKSFYDIKKAAPSDSSDKATYCRSFWDKSYILVKYYKEIFQDMSLADAFPAPPKDEGNFATRFGINSGFLTFCTENPAYSPKAAVAYKCFKKLCNEHLPRKNSLINRR